MDFKTYLSCVSDWEASIQLQLTEDFFLQSYVNEREVVSEFSKNVKKDVIREV